MKAEIGIAFGGIRQTFTTRNEHVPGPRSAHEAGEGAVLAPRRPMEIHFPVGGGEQRALQGRTGAALRLRQRGALAPLVGPVFDTIAGSLVDAFVKRAEQVYG